MLEFGSWWQVGNGRDSAWIPRPYGFRPLLPLCSPIVLSLFGLFHILPVYPLWVLGVMWISYREYCFHLRICSWFSPSLATSHSDKHERFIWYYEATIGVITSVLRVLMAWFAQPGIILFNLQTTVLHPPRRLLGLGFGGPYGGLRCPQRSDFVFVKPPMIFYWPGLISSRKLVSFIARLI